MAKISINNLASAIYDSSKGKNGSELDSLMKNTVNLLVDKHMLGKVENIINALERIIDDDEGIVRAKVSTKGKISKKMTDEIGDLIKKRYKAKEVIMTHYEDKNLLGGIKIEVGDEIIDMTLSGKIHQLQTYLNTN